MIEVANETPPSQNPVASFSSLLPKVAVAEGVVVFKAKLDHSCSKFLLKPRHIAADDRVLGTGV